MTAPFNVSSSKSIGADLMGLDHGPETTSKFDKIISNAKTIVWNGPMGVFFYLNFQNHVFQEKACSDTVDSSSRWPNISARCIQYKTYL